MQESAKNWLFLSKYRFGTGNFYGRHDGIQLHDMQFGHAFRNEGVMFEGVSPKNCFTIALVQQSDGKLCINGIKMKAGDIIIIDDIKPYIFSSSHQTLLAIISIKKSLLMKNVPLISYMIEKKFHDTNNGLSKVIEKEWASVVNNPQIYTSEHKLKTVQQRILEALNTTFTGQVGESSSLTKGEKIVLDVKSFLLDSLDEDMTIDSLLKEFDISYKTLENNFKSLLGMTPKRFLTLLKLNHVHNDLLNAKSTIYVTDIAAKWGFTHFGRFSKSYKALFNELPSETLSKSLANSKN